MKLAFTPIIGPAQPPTIQGGNSGFRYQPGTVLQHVSQPSPIATFGTSASPRAGFGQLWGGQPPTQSGVPYQGTNTINMTPFMPVGFGPVLGGPAKSVGVPFSGGGSSIPPGVLSNGPASPVLGVGGKILTGLFS